MRDIIIPYNDRLLAQICNKKELIELWKNEKRKNTDSSGGGSPKRISHICVYTDNAYSNKARRFLKDYNAFLRKAHLSWSVFPRHFFQGRMQECGLDDEQIRRAFDTHLNDRELTRIYSAPQTMSLKLLNGYLS